MVSILLFQVWAVLLSDPDKPSQPRVHALRALEERFREKGRRTVEVEEVVVRSIHVLTCKT